MASTLPFSVANAPAAMPHDGTRPSARIREIVTPGGIALWHAEDYTVPLISMQFAFLGGATADPEGKAGAGDLLTALFDEGAGDLTAEAFQERLEDFAIEMSFDMSRDRLAGSLRTLARHADEAFAMLALAVNAPRFDADAVARVKAQAIAGLKRDENDPQVVARNMLSAIAFAGHPYARPVAGDVASVSAVTRADIVALHKALLGRDALRLTVVGAIDAERLCRFIDQVFGSLPATAGMAPAATTGLQGLGTRKIIDLDVPQSTLLFAMPGIGRLDADFPAATVVNHIFGGGSFTSRLWTEVREKRGLAYSVWAQLAPLKLAPTLMGGTATGNERVAESLAVIESEIARIAAESVTAEELAKAKSYLVGSYALQFDTSRKIATHLTDLQVYGLGLDYLDRRNADIAATSLEDAQRLCARLFGDRRMAVVIAGRPQGIEAL